MDRLEAALDPGQGPGDQRASETPGIRGQIREPLPRLGPGEAQGQVLLMLGQNAHPEMTCLHQSIVGLSRLVDTNEDKGRLQGNRSECVYGKTHGFPVWS
jgi:hypothetical protein